MDFFAIYLPLFLSVASLIIVIFSIIFFSSYLKRRTSQERILSELQEEVNNILKSINEATDRDISLIEGREKELKSFLEEVDKRLNLYIREMERAKKADKVHKALLKTVQDPGTPQTEPQGTSADNELKITAGQAYQELGKKRYKINRQKASQTGETGELFEPGPSFPIPEFSIKTEPNSAPAPALGEQIRTLLLSGFSPTVVASRLEVSIAEVELAAALLERRES